MANAVSIQHTPADLAFADPFDYILVRNNQAVALTARRTVAQKLEQTGFAANVNLTVLSPDKIFSDERLILHFSLPQKYKSQFALLRGMFAFRRPGGIHVNANPDDRSFTAEFQSKDESAAIAYFDFVFQWLAREVRFKTVLREIIDFQEKVNKEQALLVSSLKSTTV